MGLNLQQGEVHRGKLKVTTLSALIHYFHEKWAPNLSNYLFQGRTIYIRAYDRWWKWREIFPFHLYFCYGTSPNYGKNLQQYFKNQKKKKQTRMYMHVYLNNCQVTILGFTILRKIGIRGDDMSHKITDVKLTSCSAWLQDLFHLHYNK